MNRSTWLHLRIPFSFFLLPVFLFALAVEPEFNTWKAGVMFILLHFFLYPASNGFNSYFDQDEDSIGGLEHPPPVHRQLYTVSLWLDLIALLGALLINWQIMVMLLIYGLISKAYSHPSVRLKKYPITGWLAAGIFQGAFTFLAVFMAVHEVTWTEWSQQKILFPAMLATALLWGSYPMTQVYQHEEDGRRGDLTISRMLGIRGTFIFTALVFLVANLGFLYYFYSYHSWVWALAFQASLAPVLGYFFYWMRQVWQHEHNADYHRTMRLNLISSSCLNLFFLGLLILG